MSKSRLMPVMTIQQSNSKEVKRLESLLKFLFFLFKSPFLLVYYIGQFAELVVDWLEDIQYGLPYKYVRVTKLPSNGKRGRG
jgi:hypothetical protein